MPDRIIWPIFWFAIYYSGYWYGMETSKSDKVNLKSLSKGKGLRFMQAKRITEFFLLLEIFIKNYSCYPYPGVYIGEL